METKERIKDRILRRAALNWGYEESELETSFDPIVAMLLEACGTELEKLSAELDNSRARIVERLLEIMSPESVSGAFPAHSIAHAKPVENNFAVSLEHQLKTRKSIANVYDPVNPIVKDLSFGPTTGVTLAAAEIEYMAFGNTMYSIKRTLHKELSVKAKKHLPAATLWLAIRCEDKIEQLDKLMFYTIMRSSHQKEAFYHYLKQAEIFVGDKKYDFREGLNAEAPGIDVQAIVTKNYNRINQIYSSVNNFYAPHFIHLTETVPVNPVDLKTPEEIKKSFEGPKIEQLSELLWVKICFPETVINDILENVLFSLNCFPVINKHLLTTNRGIDPYINYIPLRTEHSFLDLESINDSRGNSYHLKDFSEGTVESGDATLRNSGVVRFDERNASELIQYLLEMLKDESASFSVLGGDFLDQNLKQVNQLIATLEQQTKEQQFTKESFPYVIVKPKFQVEKNNNEEISIEYWATAGEDANDLRPQTRLSSEGNTDFEANEIYLVTPSVGGKMRLSTREKILSYREALLTHGRVVTFADIKAFCHNHFKNTIASIKVGKGTKVESSTKKGFTRTIDIIIEKNKNTDLPISESEWTYLCDNLLHKLETISSNVYPYRLVIN